MTKENADTRAGETDVVSVAPPVPQPSPESHADESILPDHPRHDAKAVAAARRAAFIQSLRDCADFLESHPGVTAPRYNTMNVFVNTREELAEHARAATWGKEFNGQWFSLTKSFGEDLTIEITAERGLVCRRVVTGTQIEPAKTVDVVEWICEDTAILR